MSRFTNILRLLRIRNSPLRHQSKDQKTDERAVEFGEFRYLHNGDK